MVSSVTKVAAVGVVADVLRLLVNVASELSASCKVVLAELAVIVERTVASVE